MLAKVIIAVVAFPLFAHILFSLARWVLRLVEPTLPVTETGADIVRQVSVWVAVLIGVAGSFRICRRIWPGPVIKRT